MNFVWLEAVPAGVVTVMGPVAAPAGTVVTIWVAVADTMAAGVPSNATAVASDRFRPARVTVVPAGPEAGVKTADLRGHRGGDPADRVVAGVGEPQRPVRGAAMPAISEDDHRG